jgi:hypothetical protein
MSRYGGPEGAMTCFCTGEYAFVKRQISQSITQSVNRQSWLRCMLRRGLDLRQHRARLHEILVHCTSSLLSFYQKFAWMSIAKCPSLHYRCLCVASSHREDFTCNIACFI